MDMTTPKFRTKDIAYIAVFVAVLAVCSWITVPTTVPFTLQTLGVFLAVGVLGGQRDGGPAHQSGRAVQRPS